LIFYIINQEQNFKSLFKYQSLIDMSVFNMKDQLVFLPNNYLIWIRAIKECATRDFGLLATALEDETLINYNYVISNIPLSAFDQKVLRSMTIPPSALENKVTPEEGDGNGDDPKTNSPAPMAVTAELVMNYPASHPLIDHGKVALMKARERLYEKVPSLFTWILCTMSAQSRAVVMNDRDFDETQLASDVFRLIRITRRTHLVNVQAEIRRLESQLQAMQFGQTDDYAIFTSRFNSILVGMASAGSKMTKEMVVFIFLSSLKSSVLQPAADRWLDDPSQVGYPVNFEAARNLMQMAWLNSSSKPSLLEDLPPVVMVSRQPPRDANSCVLCKKKGHTAEACWTFAVEEIQGQMVLVRLDNVEPAVSQSRRPREKKKHPPSRSNTAGIAISLTSTLDSAEKESPTLVLDTGSTIHVFRDKELFCETAACREKVIGVDGGVTVATMKGLSPWGDALYLPNCPHNLLSLKVMEDLGYSVEWSKGCLTLRSPSLEQFSFTLGESGLYQRSTAQRSISLVANHYTVEQKKRAEMVARLHVLLNHPSDDQLCGLLDSTDFLDCPLTSRDVRVSAGINGPCNSCMTGKFFNPPSKRSHSTPSDAPGELLHADVAFFQEGTQKSRPYLVVVDDFSGFTWCVRLINKSRLHVRDAFVRVIAEVKSWGHQVKVIRSDSEAVFRSVKVDLNGAGVQVQYAAPGVHEKRVEIQVRYVRNRFDVVRNSLAFNLPAFLFPRLLCDIAETMNMVPNSNSSPHTPALLMTGKKVSNKHDTRASFGSVVVSNSPSEADSGVAQQKGILGVVVGRDRDSQGGLLVFLPSRSQTVVRKYVRTATLTEDIVEKMNQLAQRSNQGTEDSVVKMHGEVILAQPFVEDVVSESFNPDDVAPADSRGERDTGHSNGDQLVPVHSRGVQNPPLRQDCNQSPTTFSLLPPPSPASPPPATPGPLVYEDGGCVDGTTHATSEVTENVDDARPGDGATVRRSARTRSTTYKDIGQRDGYVAYLSVGQASRRYPTMVDRAARAEMTQLRERGTIVPIHTAPKGETVVHSSLMMTPKFDDSGALSTMKGRLVASGNEIDPSLYGREDKSSPTVSSMSVMLTLAAASYHDADIGAIDFPGAFLLTTLGKHRYMWLGKEATAALLSDCPSWKRFMKKNGTMMVRVEGALYGFAESGKRWFDCLSTFLRDSGYVQSEVDPCIFFKIEGYNRLILSLHVDDILYVSTSDALRDEFLKKVQDRFGAVKHKGGNVIPFLGMRITRDIQSKQIRVDQPTYVADLVADMFEEKIVGTPSGKDLLARQDLGHCLVDVKDYRSRVMKLMYLATKTRPDLLFTVSTLASRCADPREIDLHHLNQAYEYLNCNQSNVMVIDCHSMQVSASVDASHDLHRDSRGHSGLVLSVGGVPVFYRSTKQKTVSTSAMQAEVAALFESIPYITWCRDLLTELGYMQDGPTPIQQDNKSALMIYDQTGNPDTRKTRHFKNKFEFVKELIADGIIHPEYVATDDMVADRMTKPFGAAKMKELWGGADKTSTSVVALASARVSQRLNL
jgi:hypothetical protein